ncbi:MAG: ABC transporter permease subunit [Acidithiobacillus sp.]|nr:ABC transporter permease subunit [Acidithiobacillus sp.]
MNSLFKHLPLVFRHEWRLLLADRSLWLTLGILCAVLAYGLFNGITATEARTTTQVRLQIQEADAAVRNVDLLRRIFEDKANPEPFANPANPANVGSGLAARYAMMPALPLAPLALGQSDMLPDHYKISYRNKTSFLYDGEIENPWNLMSGRLDAVFVVIYLLPLLIIALSYNVLSVEREQGMMKLVLSNPITLSTLLAGKLLARALPLLAGAALLPIVALLLFFPPARQVDALPQMMGWIALVLAYGLFWFALAAFVNALRTSSANNALLLISAWVVLTLIAPVIVNLAVSTANPAPSRVELATQTRLVTIAGLNRYNELLSTDYRYTTNLETLRPKDGKLDIPERLRAFYLMDRDVDAEISSLLDRFDIQVASQQALVDRFGFVSPAIVAFEGITGLSGNGSRRFQHFKEQIDTFHENWRGYFQPKVLGGQAMTESDYADIPRFVWQEESARQRWTDLAKRLFQLLLLAAILSVLAIVFLRRYRVV